MPMPILDVGRFVWVPWSPLQRQGPAGCFSEPGILNLIEIVQFEVNHVHQESFLGALTFFSEATVIHGSHPLSQ